MKIALFGIAREIVGSGTLELAAPADFSVEKLLTELRQRYPELSKLRSLAVAVNNEYADPTTLISAHDEVALIPPVSGG